MRGLLDQYAAFLVAAGVIRQDEVADFRIDPADFRAPNGEIVMAELDGRPAGVLGLRCLGDGDVEIKRMFVPIEFHGRGIGRSLVVRAEARALVLGGKRLVLDTAEQLTAAIGLYESSGFGRAGAYNANAHCTRWYAKDL